MSALARLWREHRALFLGFAAALLLMVFFGVRAGLFWAYWADPERRDLAIQGWMTPGYVARSWGVEREVVAGALGLVPGEGGRVTLDRIARGRGVPLSELEAALMAAIEAEREGR